ncbi:MAG: DNA polymerase III subunit delta [bacterium]
MKDFPPQIKDLISLDKTGGVFFIYTAERYIVKQMKEELRNYGAEKSGVETFFLDMNEGKNILLEAISTAREIGFFCSKKIVALELSDKLNDKEKDMLESYIDSSEPLNFLIVFMTGGEKQNKFFKSIQKMDKIFFSIPIPSARELRSFVISEFKPFAANEELISFFLATENQEMFYIHSEIEKIKLYALSKGLSEITYQDVDEILNGLSEQVIFKIMDFLSSGLISQALKLYRETVIIEGENKVNPLIVSMFFKHFKALVRGRILLRENKVGDFLSYLTKNRLYYLKNNGINIAGKYKNISLLEALKKLSEIELGMKGAFESKTTETTCEIEQFIVNYF